MSKAHADHQPRVTDILNRSNGLMVTIDEDDPEFSDETLAELTPADFAAAGIDPADYGITFCADCGLACRMDAEADGFSRCPDCEGVATSPTGDGDHPIDDHPTDDHPTETTTCFSCRAPFHPTSSFDRLCPVCSEDADTTPDPFERDCLDCSEPSCDGCECAGNSNPKEDDMTTAQCPECGSTDVLAVNCDSEARPCTLLCNACHMYSGYDDTAEVFTCDLCGETFTAEDIELDGGDDPQAIDTYATDGTFSETLTVCDGCRVWDDHIEGYLDTRDDDPVLPDLTDPAVQDRALNILCDLDGARTFDRTDYRLMQAVHNLLHDLWAVPTTTPPAPNANEASMARREVCATCAGVEGGGYEDCPIAEALCAGDLFGGTPDDSFCPFWDNERGRVPVGEVEPGTCPRCGRLIADVSDGEPAHIMDVTDANAAWAGRDLCMTCAEYLDPTEL